MIKKAFETLTRIILGVLAFVQLVLLLPVLAVCWVVLAVCNLIGWAQRVMRGNREETGDED